MPGRLLEPRSIFKATAFNHLSYGVADYAKSRDFYMDLLGATCTYDDGQQCALAFGAPPRELYIRARDKHPFVDHFAVSIADFDLKKVEAELKKHGYEPKYDGELAWTITDPDGIVVQVCAEYGVFPGAARPGHTKEGKVPSGSAASRPGVFKTTAVNHLSYSVADYARSRDWYIDMFGARLAFEDGLKCSVAWGEIEDAIYIVPSRSPDRNGLIDHWAFSVADFDLKDSEEKLKKLGLHAEEDGDAAWTVLDPDGYRLQICGEAGVYPGAARDFFHQLPKKK